MTARVDAREAEELIAGGAMLIDVLPATVFRQEHLPGARSLPLDEFRPEQVEPWDRAATLLVYCHDQH